MAMSRFWREKIGGILTWSFLVLGALVIYIFVVADTERSIAVIGKDISELSAEHAILIDGDTLEVLYEKNAREKAYPASTTKIMTALLVLEVLEKYQSPIEQKVKVPETILKSEGSSIYLAVNEEISIEDLLYGLMLRSGNDAAICLAEIVGGSCEEFVNMMNERAAEIGCTMTNFKNPSGLYDEEHYTSAYDMALIAAEAMRRDDFKKLSAAKEYTAMSRTGDYKYFYNKNKIVHQYRGATGIKIGYTKKSGRTLVASAEREGASLICVVFNAPDWFNDAYKLLDYGFDSVPQRSV